MMRTKLTLVPPLPVPTYHSPARAKMPLADEELDNTPYDPEWLKANSRLTDAFYGEGPRRERLPKALHKELNQVAADGDPAEAMRRLDEWEKGGAA